RVGGLNVITSLDLNVQDTAQDIVTSQIEQLQNLQITNGAALVTNPITGEILAMVGSRDYFDTSHDGNVNVTLSLRQPGSSIKPIMYAAALQHGFTPATIIDDGPVSFNIPGQPPYQPVNYDGKWHGRVTLKTALANSLNIPAVKVLNAIGVNTMLDMAKKMGISTWKDPSQYGLSLTLGGGDVTMLDMAKAYGVLANSGNRVDLKPILKVTNYRGDVLEDDSQNEETPVLPPEIAYILSGILADNNARAMEFGLNSALNIPGKIVSVKTGTTDNKRDNWTIGYTPFYLVAVWVGNNDNSPMNQYLASGITGAAPIWHEIMAGLLKDKETPAIPATDNMVAVPVCALNGMLPCEGCPTIIDYFIKGTQPTAHCEKITATPTPTP
ncbi:MAG: penicillin-binding transpeptidase domain-containing protein, partial [Patescibacteria group bacterium]|nr:penicillin-binding transpeptidase domain-containing protein [Patescibacteria group bacterium]